MSKNTTTPEFMVGEEVLAFANNRGVWTVEYGDSPDLRRCVIQRIVEEEGYEAKYAISSDRPNDLYLSFERAYPLGTILVDGKPVRPEDQEQEAAVHSDGGVHLGQGIFYSAPVDGKIENLDAGVIEGTILGGYTIGDFPLDTPIILPTDRSYTATFKLDEMDPETARLFFGGKVNLSDREFTDQFMEDAHNILDDRGDGYEDGVEDNFKDTAAMWSVITGTDVRPDQVALMMIALKLVRANKSSKRDSLLDVVGYAAHAARLQEGMIGQA